MPLLNTTVCTQNVPNKKESDDDDGVVEGSIDKGTDDNSRNQKTRYNG